MAAIKYNKLFYYAKGYYHLLSSYRNHEKSARKFLAENLKKYDEHYIVDRVNYYNRLLTVVHQNQFDVALENFKKPQKPSAYFFDTIEYSRFFNSKYQLNFLYGDVISIPPVPTIVKTRPVLGANENSVLLNLDKNRHFRFIKDPKSFLTKKDKLIGRAVVSQPHRIAFYEKYFNHPLCDLGQVNPIGGKPEWLKPKISLNEHLNYKFVLALEGNDVATNLKWILSSNSLAVMPMPKYESWFMEGQLLPDHHFIAIKDDYSDLEEKLEDYISHPQKAEEMIRQAHLYIQPFQDKLLEKILSLLVLEKYFYVTGQSTTRTIDYG